MNKLVIISHTGHQFHPELGPVGWGPTVREINFLSKYWNEVVHIGCFKNIKPLGSSIPYKEKNIFFYAIPSFGGQFWWQKLDIPFKIPLILWRIQKSLKGATEVQIRLPMGIGLILLIYFKCKSDRNFKLWIKYATNWAQPSKSLSNRLQKRLLEINWLNCPVTINGKWDNQPNHCKTFENPCLNLDQFNFAESIVKSKSLETPFTFIFIGNLDLNKGIDIIINSLPSWPKKYISKIHFVGDGPLMQTLKSNLEEQMITFKLHGFISQEEIFSLLAESHFLILPSKSEGFPKVIAEGWNFGCLPIVSNIGSISHYVENEKSGILLNDINSDSFIQALIKTTKLNTKQHREMISNGRSLAYQFTFEVY